LTRSRSGFAEAKITFDNSTNFFPVDYAEITIRRRVGRDGSSQYFMNEGEVRLRDVIDFFSKVGMGTKGFVIINQGNSDLFIKASPIERRMMLEEVLGLRQYQIKRHEAENKLKTTHINLDKAEALVEELLPHLRLLRRQSTRFEKHDQVKGDLRELEVQFFGAKLFELAAEDQETAPQTKLIDGQIDERSGELKILQAELAKIEKNQPSFGGLQTSKGDMYADFKKQQTDLLNRRSQIQKELGRLEAEAEFLLSRPKATVKEAELLAVVKETKTAVAAAIATDDIKAIKGLLNELSEKIESVLDAGNKEVQSRHKELLGLKDKFIKELEQLEKNLSELSGMEVKLAGEMREFNLVFKSAFEAVQAKQNDINGLEVQKNRLNFEKEKIGMRRAELEHQAQQWGRKLSEFNATHVSREATKGGFQLGQVENRMLKLRGELASIGDIDPAMIVEAKQMEDRYAFLSAQIDDLKKAAEDLRRLIKDLKEKIHTDFTKSLHKVNEEFNNYFRLMFNGGKAKLHLEKRQQAVEALEGVSDADAPAEEVSSEEGEEKELGLDIELAIPRKNIKGLDLLSGGERSLVSIAVLFALISVSPPPFLVLDEVDAALDENNTKRFANLVESFGGKTQFVIVTHNRATMSAANVLYGVTMGADGTSKLLSIKMEQAEEIVTKA